MAKKEIEGLTDEQIRQLLELEAQSKEIAYRRSLPWQERWSGCVKYIRENYDNVWKDLKTERIEQIKRNLEQWRDQITINYYGDQNEDDFNKYLTDKISTLKNRIDFLKAQNAKPQNTKAAKFFEDFLRKDPADMEGLKNYISQQKGKKFAACLEILQQHGFISENLAVESFMRSIFPDMEKSRYQAVVNKYYKADEDGFTFISYDEKYIKSIVNEIVEFL